MLGLKYTATTFSNLEIVKRMGDGNTGDHGNDQCAWWDVRHQITIRHSTKKISSASPRLPGLEFKKYIIAVS